MRMRIVGVLHPGAPKTLSFVVAHGQNPHFIIWRKGYVVNRWLSALTVDNEVVMTAQLGIRTKKTRPPKLRKRRRKIVKNTDVKPVLNQRIAAYALVRSNQGVLGTECSTRTAVPGLWQLPGGGLKTGESPFEALNREMAEETGQIITLHNLVELQSDHWVGVAPAGQLEDFHALRIFYTASCDTPTTPNVIDIDGTTSRAAWIPVRRWRSMPWTSGARSVLEKYLMSVRY